MNANYLSLAEEYGTDLSSRRRAAILRELILKIIQKTGEVYTLDFQGVRTVSDSFADELFAVLAMEYGTEWFKAHIKINNPSSGVRYTILSAIQERVDRQAKEHSPC